MADLMNHIGAIIKEFKAAVVFVAHQTKDVQSGKETRDRIAGSGVFVRDPDSLVYLTEHKKEGCFVVSRILRSFPPQDEFVVCWNYPIMTREDVADPTHLKLRRNANQSKHFTVEEMIAHVPVNKPIAKNQLRTKANEAGIPWGRINGLIDQAIDEGKLHSWEERRSGTRPRIIISRKPKPPEEIQMMQTI
jgi:hypothetical protein